MVLQDLPSAEEFPPVEDISDAGSLFVADDEDQQALKRPRSGTNASQSRDSAPEPRAKRRKDSALEEEEQEDESKKKMAMSVTYEGFAMYGKILCLVVKRKSNKPTTNERSAGQAIMEDWIALTQMPVGDDG